MKAVRTIEELKSSLKELRAQHGTNATTGLVPTMGYLHQGHASLMKKAREQCDIVVISIFVNPIQFGPGEDFETYPRDEQRDLAVAEAEGVDIVFIPTVETMYPQPTKTKIIVSDVTTRLCGASRPGHFDGVTTVVNKLFNLVQPEFAYFGMKDAQQVAVLQQMVQDLNMNVTIVPCPIVREADGLAMSSRNVYLSEEERKQALVLSRSLREAEQAIDHGSVTTVAEVRGDLIRVIHQSPLADIDYVDILSFPQLEPLGEDTKITDLNQPVLMALAVKFGKTRLIDNTLLNSKEAFVRV